MKFRRRIWDWAEIGKEIETIFGGNEYLVKIIGKSKKFPLSPDHVQVKIVKVIRILYRPQNYKKGDEFTLHRVWVDKKFRIESRGY